MIGVRFTAVVVPGCVRPEGFARIGEAYGAGILLCPARHKR